MIADTINRVNWRELIYRNRCNVRYRRTSSSCTPRDCIELAQDIFSDNAILSDALALLKTARQDEAEERLPQLADPDGSGVANA